MGSGICWDTHSCSIAIVFILFLFLNISVSYGIDIISASESLSGKQTLISSGGNFELGFFKPGNSTNYYIGIWYKKISVQTVVWVANRDMPISDIYSAELKIVDGNLVLLSESKTQIWSTNMNSTSSNSATAILLDDGNLVLRDVSNSVLPIWQSFDYPTHTFLPGSKLGYNKGTSVKQVLTSWKSSEDPATGRFSLELGANGSQYLIRWNRSETYWASGSWNGNTFGLVPEMTSNFIYNFSFISNDNESYFTYSLYNPSIISRLIMDVSGQIQQLTWLPETWYWNLFWSQPRKQCHVYGFCGPFSICNEMSLPFCHCLSGFEPISQNDWNNSDYSGGCNRKLDLQCGNTGRANGEKPNFLPSSQQRWPHPSQQVPVRTTGDCESMCLLNCSCSAYAYGYNTETEIMDCWIWNGDVLNIQESLQINGTGRITYFKLASSDPQSYYAKVNGKLKGIIAAIVVLVVLLFCGAGYFIYRRRVRRRREREERAARLAKGLTDPQKLGEDEKKGVDVPLIELEVILAATNDFAHANKLGQGGFGPVYKGELPGGLKVAVKRLSVHSRQGLDEFKNEVVLIAKLQHRNLVKILGYCTDGDEKILLYEYMANKSLDTFIFGHSFWDGGRFLILLTMSSMYFTQDQSRSNLDWPMRFNIIWGIIRGLLYLHHDSRVRIIHRDLKTSNILLDEEMNPKISDFGLTRIVGGRETEANTNRVVGTYGYMSPEYALDGHFSIKSDVYSFGVVMLEIISGKKNTGYYQYEEALTLLGSAWNQWNERKPLDFMDQTLLESCDRNEVLKCILVGLLCVQGDPDDRPAILNVVSMLISDVGSIPRPKQPAFVVRKRLPGSNSFPSNPKTQSNIELTISVQEGR